MKIVNTFMALLLTISLYGQRTFKVDDILNLSDIQMDSFINTLSQEEALEVTFLLETELIRLAEGMIYSDTSITYGTLHYVDWNGTYHKHPVHVYQIETMIKDVRLPLEFQYYKISAKHERINPIRIIEFEERKISRL